MNKFEYLKVVGNYLIDLDKLGKECWELCAVSEGVYYFKRPIQEEINTSE